MSKEPNRNVYVGHRYVPLFLGQWTRTKEYEGLSIVSYKGDSYTSRKRVPVGVDITNEEYWAVTGNYNAQIEEYRKETLHIKRQLDDKPSKLDFSDYKKTTDKKISDNKKDTDKKISDNKSDTDQQISDNKKETDNKITAVNNELDNKISKGKVRVSDIDINQGKITQKYISDTLLSQIAGDTPVNAVPSDLSITSAKLADNSVTNRKIGDDQVWSRNILDGNITENKLALQSVTTTKIGNNAVTSNKIDSGAVGNRILADDSVWGRNILNGSITNEKLDNRVYGKNLDGITNLNELEIPGIYTERVPQNASEQFNFPPGNNGGILEVRDMGLNVITQTYTMVQAGEIWTRRRYLGNWSDWKQVGHKNQVPLLNDDDLNSYIVSGNYKQIFSVNATKENNYPDIDNNVKTGSLMVIASAGYVTQIYIADRSGEMFTRERTVYENWHDWTKVGENSNGGQSGNIKPLTDMEVTGKWTSNNAGERFMFEMGEHEQVEIIEVGQSVRGVPLYAAVIGDPSKPAFYIHAGAHGTEVGAVESAWVMVRKFTELKNLMLNDMCIIILPNQNPDNRFIARGNKNAVDLNRDWIEQTQPETLAAKYILDNYNVIGAVDVHNFGYPREVSLKETLYGTDKVKRQSLEFFDVVTSALENDDQLVRRYAPDAPESSFTNGVASQWEIPTLLIEIPCGGYGDWTFDDYTPSPYWQAHVGSLSCQAIAKYIWKNLGDFYQEEV